MIKNTLAKKGFTLIELVVVIGLIALMTALVLPNYRSGDQRLALQRSAHKLSQDLRRVQEMAISAKEFDGAPADYDYSYGVYLREDQPTQYILFADLDNGKDYDSGEEIEILAFETRVEIGNLSPASSLTIVFSPPDPTVTLSPDASSVSITIEVETLQKNIRVNKAGLIYVE
jgi:prepilin-type N-terminal cleavage/methylation domain-containing protein